MSWMVIVSVWNYRGRGVNCAGRNCPRATCPVTFLPSHIQNLSFLLNSKFVHFTYTNIWLSQPGTQYDIRLYVKHILTCQVQEVFFKTLECKGY